MKYKYIWAWEILKGTTSADMIRGIVSLARDENAPEKAFTQLADGTWLTADKIENEQLAQRLEDLAVMLDPPR